MYLYLSIKYVNDCNDVDKNDTIKQHSLTLSWHSIAGDGWRSQKGGNAVKRMWCYGTWTIRIQWENVSPTARQDEETLKTDLLVIQFTSPFCLSLRFLTYLPLIIEISNLKIENNWLRKKKESQLTRRVYIKFKLQDLVP